MSLGALDLTVVYSRVLEFVRVTRVIENTGGWEIGKEKKRNAAAS